MIHNYLDKLTIEEIIKYAAQGFEFTINDGHIQAMTLTHEGESDERNV